MKTVCPSCSRAYDVPDEKIRANKSMRLKCPGCDSFITINSPGADSAASSLPSYDGMPEGTPTTTGILDETQTLIVPPPTASMDTVGAHLEDEMEALEEGSLRALVADEANLDIVSPVLRKTGYLITVAESVDDALTKLRFNFYKLIVFNERFDGSDPTNNELHKYLEKLNQRQG